MTNEAIWHAMDEYFNNAGSDRETNILLARTLNNRVGDGFLVGGISWIAEKIEKEGIKFRQSASLGEVDPMITFHIFKVAKGHFAHYEDALCIKGTHAGVFLATSISTATDEDELALATYLLANNYMSYFDPSKLIFFRNIIQELLNTTIGTSCRMALAWALFKFGDKHEWEEIVYGGHIWNKEYVKILENFELANNPSKNRDEIKSLICHNIALANDFGIKNNPENIMMGIFEILVLDLATYGIAFSNILGWTRKNLGF